jgi:hypothetical protein
MPRVVAHNRSIDDEDDILEESSSSEEEDATDEVEEKDGRDAVDEEEDEDEEECEDDGGKAKETTGVARGQKAQGSQHRQPAVTGRLTLSLGAKNDVCKVSGGDGPWVVL